MEVTAAERTAIYTNISPLAQRVNNYIQTQHSSIAAVAKDIGYSRTTVSRYLTGKYDSTVIGDVAEVQLVDKDGDIIASAGERVFTKTPGKGLYIAFKYNILEVEVESSNENL